jgi:fumarate reductase subunit D
MQPKIVFSQLKEAERVKRIVPMILLLLFISALLSFARAYIGVGTEELAKDVPRYTDEQRAFLQLLFAGGHVLGGMIVPLLFLLISSLAFYALFDETDFAKLVAVQLPVWLIFLIGEVALFLLEWAFGIHALASPFSLGVWGPYLTDEPFVWALLRSVSLFSVWAVYIQIAALRSLTGLSVGRIAGTVIAVDLVLAFLAAVCTEFPFEVFQS